MDYKESCKGYHSGYYTGRDWSSNHAKCSYSFGKPTVIGLKE